MLTPRTTLFIREGGERVSYEPKYPRGRAMAELNRRLLSLASWCQSRAAGEHDAETTITLLERKLDDLRMAYFIKLCETPSGKERGFE